MYFLEETGKVKKLKPNEKGEITTDKGKFVFDENKEIFKTNKDVFYFKTNYFVDKFKFIKRGPQTSHIKDLALLFAKVLPEKDWVILEAGSGSGQATIFFSRYVKEIYSFEKRKEFYNITKENLEKLGIDNVFLYNKDLREIENIEDLKDKKFDLIFLDLGEPWEFFELAKEKLKLTGFLACYIVSPRQMDRLINEWKKYKNYFALIDIFEVFERNWEVKGKENFFTKPKTTGLLFTAFIVLFRKISRIEYSD